ncbi:phosphoribosylglycinamide formyltransferase [Bacillus sp. FJAT-49736]|uniref:phosphoribosylglycinamide formyltransferase n=1 Tax=Bacillus sp. FJAT-49736 TaxID=2833582 RepID=UPI001BC9707D|nr:phosphoribosylglycinamide formyltransferase [Bacillus sp. FJAT-49736]MBS4175647.1 phosphoribosylglycinamide formyltransferase [Bacillus sp. FJAT-49736]
MVKIAVFASGNGSNFQSIVNAIKSGQLDATVELLVCDKPEAYVIERAKEESIETFVFDPKDYSSKTDFEKDIILELQKRGVQYLILAGYMRLIGPTLLHEYENRIINIHPSLLPLFPGKDAIGQAIAAGTSITGVTVHYVDEGMDTGPIIAQQALIVMVDDTVETLSERIHEIEHQLYPQTLQTIFSSGGVRHHEKSTY